MNICAYIKRLKYYSTIIIDIVRPYRKHITIIMVMSVIFSLIETGGVTAIAPFLSILANKEKVLANVYFKTIYNLFGFSSINSFFMLFGVLLIVFYILRPLYAIFFEYRVSKFVNDFFHKTTVKIINKYINMPYQNFINQNTSNLTKTVISEVRQTATLLELGIKILSEIMVFVFIYTTLAIINWKITIGISIIIGFIFVLFSLTISVVIKKQGNKRERMLRFLFKKISELFGNFKITKFLHDKSKILDEINNVSFKFSRTRISKDVLPKIPRHIVETLCFLGLIAIIEILLFKNIDLSLILPTLTVFALGIYRILPAINHIFINFNNVLFYSKSLDRVYIELIAQEEDAGCEDIEFNKKIDLKNINFCYEKDKKAIENVSITIKKGSKIAFAGESGGGKTTLADLIAGIYSPNDGDIVVDGKRLDMRNLGTWRSKIGYIPQLIYLLDDTVAKNVAFGSEYDKNRIIEVLKKAKIYDFLQGKQGLDTMVGDSGIKMSGGQRQRIGIARALYRDPEILILDEPTSALDYETEKQIINEIYETCKDKTIIIIAHRLNTIETCDIIYYIEKGKIVKKKIGKKEKALANEEI